MLERRSSAKLLCVLVLLAAPWSSPIASAADKDAKKDAGKAAGILIDRKDNWISVKVDGEDEPVKYIVDGSDQKIAEALKGLFSVSRVELTYKADGDSRKLVSIKRQVPKATGTVTGEVVKNYGWWIEVKPKHGVSDGYACNFPFDKNKDMMDKLKELQEGDSVTISFTTDFERHRIQTLHKNASPAHKGDAVSAADKHTEKDAGKVAGIYIEKKNDWITIKADGEDEPVKYTIDPSDKKLQEAFKSIFGASRVQLTYKQQGDARQLVSIKRQVLKATGTMTGEVVKVYNNFWVEVKPKHGLADAFALGANGNVAETLKQLQPGDTVTVAYTTDFERHRITSLQRHAAPAHKGASQQKPDAATDNFSSTEGGRVAGIYIDGRSEWITVKADGEDEPVKYVIDASDKRLQEAFKWVFNACRVQLTYKNEGDSRRLVSIARQILVDSGTVTGDVVKVYNNFWVEVKPKKGVADAYAAGANFKDKAFMDKLKGLKPGESVTITFNTDFERHRITSLRINDPK